MNMIDYDNTSMIIVQQPSGDIYLNLASAYTQGFMI